ncbi:MAG TPA: GspH/FimT family pseudopilin [Nitrospira sp.]|jgi:type IV fimbrial biogenesis protein FimT|nr:GspH/FimT family pseudopilin [Nitrospira sp.]
MGKEGKTLLELMITLAIAGMVSALALSNLSGLHAWILTRSTAEEIASELRLARQLAITHRDRVRVVFDLEKRTLEAQFVHGATTHHVYRYGDKGIVVGEPSAGPEILFHPSGRSATATTIYLRSDQGPIQKLTVGITGRVSIL